MILDIFTREHGLLSFIINGVYTKKNQRLASLLQLMNFVEIISYYQEQKNLNRIKEVNPGIIYRQIPFDIRRSAIGTCMLEVCRKSIKGAQANVDLYEFTRQQFISLDQSEDVDPYFFLFFLIDLTHQLGFSPLDNYDATNNCFDLLNGTFCGNDPRNIHLVTSQESEILHKLFKKLPPEEYIHTIEQRRKMMNHLISFYKFHVDQFKEIKSMEVFREIF